MSNQNDLIKPTTAPELQLQASRGWLKRAIKPPSMCKAEREAHLAALLVANTKAAAGDETELRALTDVRWCAECLVSGGNEFSTFGMTRTPYGRRRKFSNPQFMTPQGPINTYPESDEDLFLSEEQARAALVQAQVSGAWELRETLLEMEMRNKRYLRWAQEVKGEDYQEPKRSLEEVSAIYLNGGRAALRMLYTREHVAKLMTKMRNQGLAKIEQEQWKGAITTPIPRSWP